MYTGSLRGVYLFCPVSLRRCPDPVDATLYDRAAQVQSRCKSPIAEWLIETSSTGTRKTWAAKHIYSVRGYSDYQMRGA